MHQKAADPDALRYLVERPGNDPYIVRETGTDLDQRTSFRGEINPT